jgi:hypothetical protein
MIQKNEFQSIIIIKKKKKTTHPSALVNGLEGTLLSRGFLLFTTGGAATVSAGATATSPAPAWPLLSLSKSPISSFEIRFSSKILS